VTPAERLIARFEGLHRIRRDGLVHPYICPAGYATQGYGRLVASLDVPPIGQELAEAWLAEDTLTAMRQALALSPGLEGPRLDAIASFVYNLGASRYRASTLRRMVNRGDWDEAARQARRWVYGGGTKLPGLVARRELEATILATGRHPLEL
jgi:lysozyme